MLARDDMMGVILDACPSFAPQWRAFLDEWREETEVPLYLALDDLARHLIELVERWHTEGDEYVRTAATVGLLEGLQNLNLHEHGTDPAQFRAMLGPESRRCWDELAADWQEVFRRQQSQ